MLKKKSSDYHNNKKREKHNIIKIAALHQTDASWDRGWVLDVDQNTSISDNKLIGRLCAKKYICIWKLYIQQPRQKVPR